MRRSKLITGAVTGAVLIAVTLFFAARMESIASTADDRYFFDIYNFCPVSESLLRSRIRNIDT